MAIRIKYDPVGPLFLGAYASGAAQGKDRRRRELMAMAQKAQETAAAQRERALDRFERNNVFVPDAIGGAAPAVPGAPALPAPERLPCRHRAFHREQCHSGTNPRSTSSTSNYTSGSNTRRPAEPPIPIDSAKAAAAGGAASLKTWREANPAEWAKLSDFDKILIARGALAARGAPTCRFQVKYPVSVGSTFHVMYGNSSSVRQKLRGGRKRLTIAFRRESLPDRKLPMAYRLILSGA